jgi:molybdate transport system regulatory protein
MARLSIRIDFAPGGRLGPGKIALLERIAATGSISAAGRAMGMSYRRAWLLVEALNGQFREPVVATQTGGSHGGGAVLTPFGNELVATYRTLERELHDSAAERLAGLEDRTRRETD